MKRNLATTTTLAVRGKQCLCALILLIAAADVIPVQAVGIEDNDLSTVSPEELLLNALSNADFTEPAYDVRHSRQPVSDFGAPRGDYPEPERNPMAAAYPLLFPYGCGGTEGPGTRHLSYEEHVRWCLAYYDRRFRVHPTFIFAAFGILQKRKALFSARHQMKRRDFEALSHLNLTAEDLREAQADEAANRPISNPRVRLLRKHVWATAGRVLGSDASRAKYRGDIWGTSLYLNPVSVWITINPNDLHDPLVQVFAGESINMNDFNPTAGPDGDARARNVANDPYAAAKYFKTIVDLLLSKLFGVDVTPYTVHNRPGILGRVRAYFGVVEAQGRGTLHLHMLMWLVGAPTSDEMRELLKKDEFRQRIAEWIRANIRAHLAELSSAEAIKAVPRHTDVAYSRPPHPDDPNYARLSRQMELDVVRASQVHTCKVETCLVMTRHGTRKCKRRAPFPVADNDWIDADGNWGPRRSYGYLNSWCPPLVPAIRANHDVKLITNGSETKSVAFYITSYATKQQRRSHNMSALLAHAVARHNANDAYQGDIRERNRLLLYRCWNALNRMSELSAPQVVMYLMGWGDSFASHRYVPLYWSSVHALLCKEHRELSGRSVY